MCNGLAPGSAPRPFDALARDRTTNRTTPGAFIERTSMSGGAAGIEGNGPQAFSPNTNSNIMLSNARPASP